MRYKILTVLVTVLILTVIESGSSAGGWLIYHKPEFRGKVIDAETKQPIEGAVVVAVYYKKSIGLPHSDSFVIKVKETLTDKNGEFYFPSYTTIIQPLSWEAWATFIIYKPGYSSFPTNYDFMIYPVKNVNVVKSVKWKTSRRRSIESIEQGIVEEGIIFWKRGWFKTHEWNINYQIFIPLKNAEAKVKNLDIPFDYEISKDIDNVWRVWHASLPGTFSNYTVVGLKKLKTKKERLRAITYPSGDVKSKDIPLLYKSINEERRRLGLDKVGE